MTKLEAMAAVLASKGAKRAASPNFNGKNKITYGGSGRLIWNHKTCEWVASDALDSEGWVIEDDDSWRTAQKLIKDYKIMEGNI